MILSTAVQLWNMKTESKEKGIIMETLLEKFENVQIKNSSQLSTEDRIFCETQQTVYDRARNHYLSMFIGMDKLLQQELAFWGKLDARQPSIKEDVYYTNFITMDADKQKQIILDTHQQFIRTIVSYFNRKYNTVVEESSWKKYILLEEPQEPSIPSSFNWRDRESEEWKTYQKEKEQYETDHREYTRRLIHSRIYYDKILDDIFAYLGGFSFSEKVEHEIRESVHKSIENKQYTVHSRKISFQGITPSRMDYFKHHEISLGKDEYLSILRALTFYDSHKSSLKIYDGWTNKFTTHSYGKKGESTGIYSEHEVYGDRVLRFKYFKNGRWDVTFDTGTHALEFAEEYLNYERTA